MESEICKLYSWASFCTYTKLLVQYPNKLVPVLNYQPYIDIYQHDFDRLVQVLMLNLHLDDIVNVNSIKVEWKHCYSRRSQFI